MVYIPILVRWVWQETIRLACIFHLYGEHRTPCPQVAPVLSPIVPHYFLRVGSLAHVHIGRAEQHFERGETVLVRTAQGVEVADLLGEASQNHPHTLSILRALTDQDQMLLQRMTRDKTAAITRCRDQLKSCGSQSTLLDVDHLIDGTLVLHFLGDVDSAAEENKDAIAETYESVVGSREIAKQLSAGCGPNCGTELATGCSSGGCQSCSVKCVAHSAH